MVVLVILGVLLGIYVLVCVAYIVAMVIFDARARAWWREVGEPGIAETEAVLGMHYNAKTHTWTPTR